MAAENVPDASRVEAATTYFNLSPAMQAFYARRGMWADGEPRGQLAAWLGERDHDALFWPTAEALMALRGDACKAPSEAWQSTHQRGQFLRRLCEAGERATGWVGKQVPHGSPPDALKGAEWRKKAAEAEAEVARETAALASLPGSKKEFAKMAADTFWSAVQVLNAPCFTASPSGYYFSAADRERIDALTHNLYWAILRAKPRLDAARRFAGLNRARANAAKSNLPLQRALSAAMALQLSVEPEHAP